MATAEHYFYVLHCRDGSYYGGYTTNLTRRLAEHNAGIGAKYTHPQSRRPLTMIHAEVFKTRSEATKAEAAFKKLPRPLKDRYLRENHARNVVGSATNKRVNAGKK